MKAGNRNRRGIAITLLGIVAGLIFLLSLAVHFSTFLPNPAVSMDMVWPIGVAIFVPFGFMVMILALRRQTARKNTPDPA